MKFYLFVLIALLGVAGCSLESKNGVENSGDTAGSSSTTPDGSEADPSTGVNATPKDALAAFVEAVKQKDEKGLKSVLSEKTNKLIDLQAKVSGKGMMELFDSEAFEDISKMPETRNEKIDGDKATLEAKDPDGDDWDEMPFVRENGSWKIALLDAEYDKDYEKMAKEAEKMMKDKDDGSNSSKSGSTNESETQKTN